MKFPFFEMSASWFLVSVYLIWILESRFDRTTNQVQLCEFWKHVSLLDSFLLMVTFFTASLSSNTYNKASCRADWTFEGTESISTLVFFETCDVCEHHSQVAPIDLKHEKYFQEQKRLDSIIPERANHPVLILRPKR